MFFFRRETCDGRGIETTREFVPGNSGGIPGPTTRPTFRRPAAAETSRLLEGEIRRRARRDRSHSSKARPGNGLKCFRLTGGKPRPLCN